MAWHVERMTMSAKVDIHDVLCGKGQGFMKHPGNQDFRQWVKDKGAIYESSDESSKKRIVEEIISLVECRGGRFLSFDAQSQTWSVLHPKKVRDKTAQALRDCRTKRERKGPHKKDTIGGLPLLSHTIACEKVRHDVWMADNHVDLGIGSSTKKISTDGLSDSLSKISLETSGICNRNTEDVSPMTYDVLSGLGKGRMNHPGNQDFRRWINERIETYCNSDDIFKRNIVQEVIALVECRGGRFLNQDLKNGRWHVMDSTKAIEKTSQAFRDMRTKRAKSHQRDDYRQSSLSSSDTVRYDKVTSSADILLQADVHLSDDDR